MWRGERASERERASVCISPAGVLRGQVDTTRCSVGVERTHVASPLMSHVRSAQSKASTGTYDSSHGTALT